MPLSTYKELQDEALSYAADAATYRPRVKVWLNRAQEIATRKAQPRDVFYAYNTPTVAGTGTVTFSSTIIDRVDSIEDTTSNRRLRPLDYAVISLFDAASGPPLFYSLGPGLSSLYLWPTPDAIYNINVRGWRQTLDMSGDSDYPTIQDDYYDLLVSYAVAQIYLSEDDPEMYQVHMGIFDRRVMEMGVQRNDEIRDGPVQVPGTWAAPQQGW